MKGIEASAPGHVHGHQNPDDEPLRQMNEPAFTSLCTLLPKQVMDDYTARRTCRECMEVRAQTKNGSPPHSVSSAACPSWWYMYVFLIQP